MYYQIDNEITTIQLQNIKSDKITLGLITLKELEECYKQFSFSPYTVAECKNTSQHIHSNIDVYEDYCFGIINGINASHILKATDKMGIYMKHNLFLIVVIEDEDGSIGIKLTEALKRLNMMKPTLERVIYGFFERLICDNHAILESIEAQISEHEDKINDRETDKEFNSSITDLRKKLLLLHNYFEQLITMGEELQENGNDLFEEENLRYFKIFTDRVTRLSDNTKMLRDYIAQVKEAYQAQLDYTLNSTMKLFTVVTTIFLPLTLIVGWYGMNFTNMPELHSKFGYPSVMIGSVIVIIICLIYFKKKKFL